MLKQKNAETLQNFTEILFPVWNGHLFSITREKYTCRTRCRVNWIDLARGMRLDWEEKLSKIVLYPFLYPAVPSDVCISSLFLWMTQNLIINVALECTRQKKSDMGMSINSNMAPLFVGVPYFWIMDFISSVCHELLHRFKKRHKNQYLVYTGSLRQALSFINCGKSIITSNVAQQVWH